MKRHNQQEEMYWEDFAHFVIRAGLPYTQQELAVVIDRAAQGAWEGYAMEYNDGFGLRSQSKAEEFAEEVRKELEQVIAESGNTPQQP